MNLLDRLLGRRPDPTINWGEVGAAMPAFDLATMRFGSLRFGDGFEAAAFLGRPARFTWTLSEYCELLYAPRGFQIDYDKGRFAYVAFFIGPDDHLPNHPAMQFSTPRVDGCTPGGIRLSRATDRMMLERLFGAADSVDAETREVILNYTQNGVTMEFELDGKTGGLKRWNLYPE